MCFSEGADEENVATESFYHSWTNLVCDALESQCHTAVRNQMKFLCVNFC